MDALLVVLCVLAVWFMVQSAVAIFIATLTQKFEMLLSATAEFAAFGWCLWCMLKALFRF